MRHCGYTLLEMVVVMTIIGLITAITVPKLSVMYDRVAFSLQRDDLLSQIKVLGYKANMRGKGFTLQQAFENPDLLEVADGWKLEAGESIYYSAIGTCAGGVSEISKGKARMMFNLEPPFCSPQGTRVANE